MKDKQDKIKIWCIHLHKGLERLDQTLCGVVLWRINFIDTGICLRIYWNITTLCSKCWKRIAAYQGMTLKIFFFSVRALISLPHLFFFLFRYPLFLFVCVFLHAHMQGTPRDMRVNFQIPWSLSYRYLWAIQCGHWELISVSSTQGHHCSPNHLLETVQFSHKWNQAKQTSLADCCS